MDDNATKTATTSLVGRRAQQEERFQTKEEACWMTPQACKEPIRRLSLAESCNIYFEYVLMIPPRLMSYGK